MNNLFECPNCGNVVTILLNKIPENSEFDCFKCTTTLVPADPVKVLERKNEQEKRFQETPKARGADNVERF